MHILSHGTALTIILFLAVLNGAGESMVSTCFIRAGSWADYLMYLPLGVYFPFSVSIVIYAFVTYYRTRMLKRRIFLLRFSIVILIYEVCWAPMCVLHVSRAAGTPPISSLMMAAWVMSSLAGLFINTVRLLDSALMRRLKRNLRKRAAKRSFQQAVRISLPSINSTVSDLSLLDTDIHQFLRDVFLESVLSAFLNVSLSFQRILAADVQPESVPRYIRSEKRCFYISPREVEASGLLDDQLLSLCNCHLVAQYEVRVTEYAPTAFAHLRDLDHVPATTLLQAFNPVLNKPLIKQNAGNRGGRSDAFLSFSADRKFIMKTLNHREKSFLLNAFLPAYFHHIQSKASLLARVLGVFCFEDNRGVLFDIMLMRSVITAPGSIVALFDLKGSQVARRLLKDASIADISGLERGQIYKDMDFLQTVGSLQLPLLQRNRLLETLQSDIQLLSSLNVMDYSLLLAFTPHSNSCVEEYRFSSAEHSDWDYYMGVIDYLQEYTSLKRLETFGKGLVRGYRQSGQISIVNPVQYAARFQAFIAHIVSV